MVFMASAAAFAKPKTIMHKYAGVMYTESLTLLGIMRSRNHE
jgi:hypothetical protein